VKVPENHNLSWEWKNLVWVRLVEAEYEPDNDAAIKTAIVKYTDKSKNELTQMLH